MAKDTSATEKLSRSETITALSHYYRAEAQRSLAWRERLDRTTNWAVGGTAVFLGFGFNHPDLPHAFFLFALALIYMLLFVEARRYRFYDAYEYRVRLLHQNFIYSILANNTLPEDFDEERGTFWRAELAADLRHPQYKMGFLDALGRRLFANYIYLFAILMVGWLLKIGLHPTPAHSWPQYLDHAAIGKIPGVLTFVMMGVFILHLMIMVRSVRRPGGGGDVIFPKR